MANSRDVRRLATTAMVLVGVALLWLLLLVLDDQGEVEWAWPTAALDAISLAGWLGIILVVLVMVLVMVVFGVFSIRDDGPRSVGPVRQVQCQECEAVFQIPDNGERPLFHHCPHCNALGVYEGDLPPVGELPTRPRPGQKMSVGCSTCGEQFSVIDTGRRPMRIRCPTCRAAGLLE